MVCRFICFGVIACIAFATRPGEAVTLAASGHRVIAPGLSSGYSNGDTWDTAWAADDTLYLQQNDGTGFRNSAYVHDRVCKLQGTPQMPGTLSGFDLNPGSLGNSLNGPCYSTGIYEVDGVLYHNLCYSQQIPGAWVFHHTSTIKSLDHGKTWINHLGQTNTLPPDDAVRCMFQSESWGQVNFVKYGKGGAAPDVDNAQRYIYYSASGVRLARVLRTDLPKLDKTKIQYYLGGDGMLDSNWTNNIAMSQTVAAPLSSPTAIVYDERLARYLMTAFQSDSWQSPPIESTISVMEAPHPWGPWTLVLQENVNNRESDNLTWAFLIPKFTSADGKKMWVSTSGRTPYGLQFLPVYLSTEPPLTQEAEAAILTGASIATAKAGYTGAGYVTGIDAIGDQCQFTFDVADAGVYIIQFRYNTSAYRNISLYVNGQRRSILKLGKSEQVYATWTSASAITLLNAGANQIALRCEDTSGNVNVDSMTIALYSRDIVSGVEATCGSKTNTLTLGFDSIPGLKYTVEWKSNLLATTPWQATTNFTSAGSRFQATNAPSTSNAFYRFRAQP
jgi:hypothetical protein